MEGVAIALLAVLVAGLLRSHARILNALSQQGAPVPSGPSIPQPVAIGRRPERTGTDLVGVTPADGAVSVSVASGVDTLLAFLTGGCPVCGELWSTANSGGSALPDRTRLVVVTASPDRESPSRIRRLAPVGLAVVMSSDAWEDYRVPGAPYFVLVEGATGRIAGEGSAQSWAQVASLVASAAGDGAGHGRGPDGPRGPRESRVDAELAAAGIHPGDPRLYHPPLR